MISTIFKYNLWANEKIASVLPKEKMELETASSFSSLKKTLYHMWDAESIWLKRIKGESLNDWPSKSFTGTIDEAIQSLLEHNRKFIDYVSGLSDADLQKNIKYTNIKGEPFEDSLNEILHHVANHATYHRGQLITMIRQLGHEGALPQTDMIVYFRDLKRGSAGGV